MIDQTKFAAAYLEEARRILAPLGGLPMIASITLPDGREVVLERAAEAAEVAYPDGDAMLRAACAVPGLPEFALAGLEEEKIEP